MAASSFTLESSEGLPIRGDVDAPFARGPVVVCLHGFKGFKDWGFWPETARRLAAAGFAVVRFNFSHSGMGEDPENISEPGLFESATYSAEVADLLRVLSAIEAGELPLPDRMDVSRVGLLGHSRASICALAVATREKSPVGSVVLWNPVSRTLWWDPEERRRWRERGFWEVINTRTRQVFRVSTALLEDAEKNGAALDPAGNAARLEVPFLTVVAREDESVPPEAGTLLARAAAARLASLVEIAQTGHTFGAVHPFAGVTPALAEALDATRLHLDQTLRRTG